MVEHKQVGGATIAAGSSGPAPGGWGLAGLGTSVRLGEEREGPVMWERETPDSSQRGM